MTDREILESYLKKIRKNIEFFRKDKKLSKAKLSRISGVSYDEIKNICVRKTFTNISMKTLIKLSIALEINLERLIL